MERKQGAKKDELTSQTETCAGLEQQIEVKNDRIGEIGKELKDCPPPERRTLFDERRTLGDEVGVLQEQLKDARDLEHRLQDEVAELEHAVRQERLDAIKAKAARAYSKMNESVLCALEEWAGGAAYLANLRREADELHPPDPHPFNGFHWSKVGYTELGSIIRAIADTPGAAALVQSWVGTGDLSKKEGRSEYRASSDRIRRTLIAAGEREFGGAAAADVQADPASEGDDAGRALLGLPAKAKRGAR